MPEFQMPFGSDKEITQFVSLDSFTQGYVMAMFFTETGTGDDEDLQHATFGDLSPEALAKIKADCADFQEKHAELIDIACDTPGYDIERAGNDFWYTRNHHGVGYWGRGLAGDDGKALTAAAHAYGETYIYRGTKKKIYVG